MNLVFAVLVKNLKNVVELYNKNVVKTIVKNKKPMT